jgi:hypothetical protein
MSPFRFAVAMLIALGTGQIAAELIRRHHDMPALAVVVVGTIGAISIPVD